jgi:hypothetical protein
MLRPPLNDIIKTFLEEEGWRRHFILCPDYWRTYTQSHDWQGEKLEASKVDQIPDDTGIYTLILQPGIAGHKSCSYLMYVGQAISLRKRFRDYLGKEKRETGRPKIFVFLNLYTEFICFYYTLVNIEILDAVEDGLVSAYQPPLNDQIPGTVGVARRAFT